MECHLALCQCHSHSEISLLRYDAESQSDRHYVVWQTSVATVLEICTKVDKMHLWKFLLYCIRKKLSPKA
ncbi:hypothetical protein C0J52_23886 [Blattella germanica]|nr:hypothetical protein C0J52_23886 [Blattella germanica]